MATITRKIALCELVDKVIYQGPEAGTWIQHFKDEAIININQKIFITGKGVVNNRISEYLMLRLSEIGIQNYFLRTINMREQLVKEIEPFKFIVAIRNIASGSFCTRYNIERGVVLPRPIIEFSVDNLQLDYPLISEEHIFAFNWADRFDLDEIKHISLRVNDFLTGLLMGCKMRLIDFKLMFGRDPNDPSQILLSSDITPDSARIWDLETNEKLSLDRFEVATADTICYHNEIARRLGVMH